MVTINLHGKLGKKIGRKTWVLDINSVGESMHAINTLTRGKLYKILSKDQKKNIKYSVKINDKGIKRGKIDLSRVSKTDVKKFKEQMDFVRNSDLTIKRGNLEKIDLIPIVEGAGRKLTAIFMIIVAIILIVIGAFLLTTPLAPLGFAMIMAGLALLAAGIQMLLMDPPEFEQARAIEGTTTSSYLFNGPVNNIKEGGPVPVCYGELMCGSQVLASYYDIDQVLAKENQITN